MEKKIPSRIKRIRNMKIKKSTIGMFVAVFAFVFSMFYVFAGENPKISLTSVESAKVGDEVTLYINLEDNKDYTSIGYTVQFDPDVLEFKKASINEYTKELTDDEKDLDADERKELGLQYNFTQVIKTNADKGEVTYFGAFVEGQTAKYDNQSGKIVFKVKDGASGKIDVKLTKVKLSILDNGQEVSLNPEVEDGYVKVSVPVDIDSVTLETDNFELQKGDNKNLVVNYAPENTTDEGNYTYEVVRGDAVTVDENGKVTAVKTGTATIKVMAFGKELIATVTVVNHITKVEINASKTEINKGEELQLTAIITPDDTSDSKILTWDSSNKNAATVDENGKVVGVSGGTTTITATSENNVVGSITIKVVVPMISFTTNDKELSLNKGETHEVMYEINPEDTTESKEITWSSDKESVATVTNGVITAVGGGNAVITGILPNQKSITINVTVNVPLESIELDKESIELLPTQKQTLNLTINPEDTTDDSLVVWSSNNEQVATVTNGEVTAVASGNATITVTKGSKSDTVSVHVLKPIDSFVISEREVTLNRNESKNLTVTILPDDAEESKTVTWTSSDPESVSVDQNGKITGLKGTQSPVTITGKLANGKEVTCNVTVVVLINDISLNKTSTTINKGETETLTVTIDPEDTSEDTTVTWDSSDKTVATVDSTGKVTALKAGTTTISATVGNHTKNCAVTVNVPISSVTVETADFELARGDNKQVVAKVNPDDATGDKTITWTSSDETVATVDSTGKVTAVGKGNATITATAGGKSDTVKVTVYVPITSFTTPEEAFSLVKFTTKTIDTTINPSDTTENKKITWTSSNNQVATVDQNGKVTGVAAGTAKITGKLENNMKVEVNVTVTIIPVESITISKKTLDMLRKDTETLSVTYSPENATEIEDVTWTSSDETVATVDEEGNVTALKEGTATITAKMGNLTDTANVTVTEVALTGISLEDNKKEVETGNDFKLNVTLEPFDATDDVTYTYESSDPEIAEIDEEGNVIPKKPGKVKFTVKASNGTGEFEDTIELEITAPKSPQTGVTPIWVYGGIISILLVVALVIYKKKELF